MNNPEGETNVRTMLQELSKSVNDTRIAGICGGFAESTPVPSWLWRTLFVIFIFVGGIGPIAYLAFWIFMPAGETKQSPDA